MIPSVNRRARTLTVTAAATAALLLAASCTSTGGSGTPQAVVPTAAISAGASHPPTTITVWTFNTLANEVAAFRADLGRLHTAYPWLTVKFVPGKDDAAFAKAVAAHDPPDVFISTAPDNVGQFCHNGTVLDMTPYLRAARVDAATTFPKASLVYTQYQGKQCALPLLTDAYGLYYNKAMFARAGISGPPRTFSQLIADARKLTVKNSDGSIRTFGMITRSDYNANSNLFTGVQTGSVFYNAAGRATFATDPKWKQMLTLDKTVDGFYGAGAVQKFVARYQPHTDDAANPFVAGAAAMELDGEWHVGEIAGEKPGLDYGVAPFPVPDDQASRYGVGNTQGTVVYLPSHTRHPQEAFFAVQQLATDTTFLNTLADAVSNIPSTFSSLAAWNEAGDPHWKPLIAIFKNSGSYYKQLTPAGSQDATTWAQFVSDYEQAKVSNLQSGLTKVAGQVDSVNAQASGQ